MLTTPGWVSRPIFITSTFRDMHAERDHLRSHVIPALEERLRARRCHLEAIDLRWGVETLSVREAEDKELMVLKVCLAEVERSRPFLIAIIGDRYGWIPPAERIDAAAREAGFAGDVAGASVTELEIAYGVLSSPSQRRRSLFYVRDPLPYDRMPPQIAEAFSEAHNPIAWATQAAHKLAALKDRIAREVPDRVRHYSARWDETTCTVVGLDAWGHQVLEDLWEGLVAETPSLAATATPTWQAEERWTLEQFVEDRVRGFRGRAAILQDISVLALSPAAEAAPWAACVTGAAGAGKSALFAKLVRRLQDHGDVLVLAHAAGIGPRSTQVDSMLRRWIEELAEAGGEANALREDAVAQEVEETFERLLAAVAAQRRVVVVLDALDRFEATSRARSLTWLPKVWPTNARLITTAIPGPASDTLSVRRGVTSVALPALTEAEADEVVRDLCGRYHRVLHPAVLAVLLAKRRDDGEPAVGNPLWLVLAVEELNLLDADDFARAERDFGGSPDERLHHLLLSIATELPADVSGMYGWLLERAERLHGSSWTSAFVDLIALSRGGWRETDLRTLMPEVAREPWADLRFATLRRTFRAHLTRGGSCAQWRFSHAQMESAVRRRHGLEGDRERTLHAAAADYLLALPAADPLHQTETVLHLLAAGNEAGAARYLGRQLDEGEASGASEAVADWIATGTPDVQKQRLDEVMALIGREESVPGGRKRLVGLFVSRVSIVLRRRTSLAVVDDFLRAVTETLRSLESEYPTDGLWHYLLATALAGRADALRSTGRLQEAARIYEEAVFTLPQIAVGDFEPWLIERDAVNINLRAGDVAISIGALEEAELAYRRAMAILEHNLEHDDAGRYRGAALSKLADVLSRRGNMRGSLAMQQDARAVLGSYVTGHADDFEADHMLCVAGSKVGDLLLATGDFAGALDTFREGADRVRGLIARDPERDDWRWELGMTLASIGLASLNGGDAAGAITTFQEALDVATAVAGRDRSNAAWRYGVARITEGLGDAQLRAGNTDRAVAEYSRALSETQALVDLDDADIRFRTALAQTHCKLGDALVSRGDPSTLIAAYTAAATTWDDVRRRSPETRQAHEEAIASWQRLGDVLRAAGSRAEALTAYESALRIVDDAPSSWKADATFRRHRSILLNRIGNLELAGGDSAAAFEKYRAALEIFEKLRKEEPDRPLWSRDIAFTLARMAILSLCDNDRAAARKFLAGSANVARTTPDGTADAGPGTAGWADMMLGAIDMAEREREDPLQAAMAETFIARRLFADYPTHELRSRYLLASLLGLARAHTIANRHVEALPFYREALAIGERLTAAHPTERATANAVAATHEHLAYSLCAVGDHTAAHEHFEQACQIADRALGEGPVDPSSSRRSVAAHYGYGWFLGNMGDSDGRRRHFVRCREILMELRSAGEPPSPEDERLLQHLEGILSDPKDLGS